METSNGVPKVGRDDTSGFLPTETGSVIGARFNASFDVSTRRGETAEETEERRIEMRT